MLRLPSFRDAFPTDVRGREGVPTGVLPVGFRTAGLPPQVKIRVLTSTLSKPYTLYVMFRLIYGLRAHRIAYLGFISTSVG